MELENAFGTVLQRYRVSKGISQEELAAKSGLHRTYISLLERGLRNPSLSTVCRLAQALAVPAHVLVKLTEEEVARSS